jgi:hypothetical protein
MKNLIPFAFFEAVKPEAKLFMVRKTIMTMFSDKYNNNDTLQHGNIDFSKFVPQIGDVVNSYLKSKNIDEIYNMSKKELKDKIFTEIDEKVVNKLKNNDQFKKLFLDKSK